MGKAEKIVEKRSAWPKLLLPLRKPLDRRFLEIMIWCQVTKYLHIAHPERIRDGQDRLVWYLQMRHTVTELPLNDLY